MPEKKEEKVAVSEIQLVIFRLSGEEFGLDIGEVREIIRMQNVRPMPKAPKFIDGVINLRGQIIAVMDLAKRFGITRQENTEKTRIVVIDVHGNTVGLIVDEVPEVVRLAEESVEPTPTMIETQIHEKFIRGMGKLGERLIILLAAEKLLTPDEMEQYTKVVTDK